MIVIPRLYPILDATSVPDTDQLCTLAEQLIRGGCRLLQYRNKSGDARTMLEQAKDLKQRVGTRARLMVNDRADLCLAAGFDGVHVGQEDLSPEAVRAIIGPDRWMGVSTHNPEQLRQADLSS